MNNVKLEWKDTSFNHMQQFTCEITGSFRLSVGNFKNAGWRQGFGRKTFASLEEAKVAAVKAGITQARKNAKLMLSIADLLKRAQL